MRRIFVQAALSFAALVWLSWGASARAQVGIESHVGSRPLDADGVIVPFRKSLLAAGVQAYPKVVATEIRDVPMAAIKDPSLAYSALRDHVELAWKTFLNERNEAGDYVAAARQQFEEVVRKAHDNPGVVILDGTSRELMTRAYVGLALCQDRGGDPTSSNATIAELIRSYPEQPITRGMFGKEAEKLYNRGRAIADGLQRGKLLVQVSEPDAQVFINEFGRGRGGTFTSDVLPGSYRILVKVGTTTHRYNVDVSAGGTSQLTLDWRLEQALVVSEDWVGFMISEADRDQQELEYARGVSRKLGGVSSLVVTRVAGAESRRVVVGSRYEQLAGRGLLVRRGRVQLGGRDDQTRLDALAGYVVKGTSSPLVLEGGSEKDNRDPSVATSERRSRLVPGLVLATGALVIAAGLTLFQISEIDDGSQPTYRDTRPAGIGIAVTGAAVVGTGISLWMRRSREAGSVGAVLVGGGIAAFVSGTVLYALDEDVRPDGYIDCCNTARTGVIVGAVGALVAGAGAVLWLRGGPESSTPVVAVRGDGTFVGWAGSF